MVYNVTRPALRYYGSKWRLAALITEQLPPHVCYVEPFGGSAAVLLQKAPSYHEVYNDADHQVVTFFRMLRDRPDDLIQAIELTPFSRDALDRAYQPAEAPLEVARRFYVRAWQSRGGGSTHWRSGWRYQKSRARGKRAVDDWNDTGHLWALVARLKQVQLECDDAFTIIPRYDSPETCFYLDPPYPASTRGRWAKAGYRHEMSDADHRALAELLHGLAGMVILSSYPSALYEELFADWTCKTEQVRTEGRKKATEVLWISPAAVDAALPLFR